MPFTFVAQQALVLPLGERFPERFDGVALVVGTMAPDLAYITRGWGYGPDGLRLWFDGHRLQNVLVLTIGSVLLTWLVRRVVLPSFGRAVPDLGRLHLRDLQWIADHRPRWWVTAWSALAGELLHLAIDVFVHPDEPVVEHVALLRRKVGTIGGSAVHVYTLVDLVLTAVLVVFAGRWLLRAGRDRAFLPSESTRESVALSSSASLAFWAIVSVGCVGGLAYAVHRNRTFGHFATVDTSMAVISFAWVAFAGLVVASLAVRPTWRNAPSGP